MLLYQIGVLQLDKIISIFMPNGYESDEDCDTGNRKRSSRHKNRSRPEKSNTNPDSDDKERGKKNKKPSQTGKSEDSGFTPIQSILKNKQSSLKLRGEEILYPWDTKGGNDESIEDIQTKIMSELNTKEQPLLTPVSY